MTRLVILAMLVLALTSFAKAQDPCPTCNDIHQQAVTPPVHTQEDNNDFYRPGRRRSFSLYMNFDASVAVNNNTAKTIKRITWESSLINSVTRETVAIYPLVTNKKIGPHQRITINKKVEVPLDPRVISASQVIRRRGVPNVIPTEQVGKVREIEYTDGSVSAP